MVKECPVILNNRAVTVVEYGEIKVQLPAVHKDVQSVFVKFEDGKYTVVEKPEPVVSVQPEEKEVVSKKPQKKIVKNNEVSDDEIIDVKDVIPENDIIADAE